MTPRSGRKLGSRDYISPFRMYESLIGGSVEIRQERGCYIFFIGGRDKRQGLR